MAKESDQKFNLPKRVFCDTNKPKKLISIRLPDTLVTEIKRIADERQWDFAEVVTTALDEFAQWDRREKKSK